MKVSLRTNFKLLKRFLLDSFFIYIFLMPAFRMLNIYYTFINPLILVFIICSFSCFLNWQFSSAHMVYIHYFAAKFLLKTEVFWLNIYLILIRYYLTPFVLNVICCLVCYYLLTPSLWFLYLFFLWSFTIFFLLFFKVYFTRAAVPVMLFGGKRVKAIYVTSKIISSVFYNLSQTCRRFELQYLAKARKFIYFKFFNENPEHLSSSCLIDNLGAKSLYHCLISPKDISSIKSIDIKFFNWLEWSFSISLITGYLFIAIFLKI